jgi:hypothetical protein
MVITEEVVTTSHARVPLKDGVGVQTANDRRGWRIFAGLLRLPTDTEEVGNEVSINEVGGINDESRGPTIHVKACSFPDSDFHDVQ